MKVKLQEHVKNGAGREVTPETWQELCKAIRAGKTFL